MSNFAKKNLGQNFLIDKNKIKEIIKCISKVSENEILEIGPGRGALTRDLVENFEHVTAIEIDDDLIPLLKEIDGLYLIHADVLKIDFKSMIKNRTTFVSNLPYYISTKILFMVLENENFTSANVMLQKELVDRIYANINSKEYGRLSVAIRSFFEVEKIIKVPSTCFAPKPNVDSSFISLIRKENFTDDIVGYLEFIKNSFAMKRKKWLNSLRNSKSEVYEHAMKWLEINNKEDGIRAEQITVEEFKDIWISFKE